MIQLSTRAGLLELDDPTGDRCATCRAPVHQEARLAVRVKVRTRGRQLDVPAVCGNCLTEALALFFGRRHVQQGGNASDLQLVDPPEPPDSVA